jgi:hypothetical protein
LVEATEGAPLLLLFFLKKKNPPPPKVFLETNS